MIEYLSLAITTLKTAKDIASTLLEIRDIDKVTSSAIELKSCIVQTYGHIISEQERSLSLQTKILELEKECARLKDWSAERQQYTRKLLSSGVFAYVANDYQANLENAHKLCCNCFDKSVKSTLQQTQEFITRSQWEKYLICPNGCPRLEFDNYIDEV